VGDNAACTYLVSVTLAPSCIPQCKQARIGGYLRNETRGQYEDRFVKETVVHPNFTTGFTGSITYVSCWPAGWHMA